MGSGNACHRNRKAASFFWCCACLPGAACLQACCLRSFGSNRRMVPLLALMDTNIFDQHCRSSRANIRSFLLSYRKRISHRTWFCKRTGRGFSAARRGRLASRDAGTDARQYGTPGVTLKGIVLTCKCSDGPERVRDPGRRFRAHDGLSQGWVSHVPSARRA